ncbi:MAG: hypothetical protein RBU30_14610 [Polyangia bacterium]|nr:hypothetical protein [Polyangia bacterium]
MAKRDLLLEQELRRLGRFDAVIVDDLGYIQQDRDEMEVLFTFHATPHAGDGILVLSLDM